MADLENIEIGLPNAVEVKDTSEDFEMEHSDEEMRMIDGKEWEPTPDEIVELFERIDKEKVLELEWTTPGRRPPTPAMELDSLSEDNKDPDRNQIVKSDFDFKDESKFKLSSKAIRPTTGGLRGSAKKKTTSLDAILSNMARHRKLDMMDDDDENPLP